MRRHLLGDVGRIGIGIVAAWLFSVAYLPQAAGSAGGIVGAAWADHDGCDCQYDNDNRGCPVVSDGYCNNGWVNQCETVNLNPPTGTCRTTNESPCGDVDPGSPHNCGFVVNQRC